MRPAGRVLRRVLPALAATVIWPGSAAASAPDCHTHEHFRGLLAETYDQSVQLSMVTPNGHVLEVWASARGGWTLLEVLSPHAACIVARGRSWLALPLIRSPGEPA